MDSAYCDFALNVFASLVGAIVGGGISYYVARHFNEKDYHRRAKQDLRAAYGGISLGCESLRAQDPKNGQANTFDLRQYTNQYVMSLPLPEGQEMLAKIGTGSQISVERIKEIEAHCQKRIRALE